jgi:hypothetical protein
MIVQIYMMLREKNTELCYLAFSGRHRGITVWVLNQKYNYVVKDNKRKYEIISIVL